MSILARLGLGLLLLGASVEARPLLAQAGPSRGPSAQGELRARLVAELQAFEPGSPTAWRLTANVAGLGSGVAPEVLSILADGRVPASPPGVLPAREAEPLGPERVEALLEAARRLGRPAFAPAIDDLPGTGAPWELRRAALDVLAAVGRPRDLELAVRLLELPADDPSPAPATLRELEETAAALFRRDVAALRAARKPCAREPLPAALALVSAAGSVRSPESLELLADLLGSRPDLDLALLSQIERVARELPTADDGVRVRVRGYLWSENEQIVRKAAETAALLEDYDAVPRLIELLESEDSVRLDGATRALHALAGLALPARTAVWSDWYERERRWYEERAARLYRILDLGEDVHVREALVELGSHRYRRDETARHVARLLDHQRTALRRTACLTLRRISSRAAVPALIELLEGEDEELSTLAWQSLQAITGWKLPAEREAWSTALLD